jgi:ParB/RepB/Spo0J family partition protein
MSKKDRVVHKTFDPNAVVEGPEPKKHGYLQMIPLAAIHIDESFNSRDKIDVEGQDFIDLRESIRREGLQQPIKVSPITNPADGGPIFDLIAGFHRTFACRQLGHEEIPALVQIHPSHADALVANIVENTHRRALRPYELASACHRLRKDGLSVEEIATRIQMSTSYIGNLTRCMEKLPREILTAFKNSDTIASVGDYIRIAGRESKEDMLEEWKNVIGGSTSTKPEKPADEDKKNKPKVKNAEAIRRFIAELKTAEAIVIKGEQVDLTEEMIEALTTGMRWACGLIKKYPLVIPNEEIDQ